MPVGQNDGQVHRQVSSRTHQCLDAQHVCDVDMPRGVESGSGVIGGNVAGEFCLMHHPSVKSRVDRELVVANRDHPDLRYTFLARVVRSSTEYSGFLQRELESS